MIRPVWIGFLVLWALTQTAYGAVVPWSVSLTALGLVALHLALPVGIKLSKAAVAFLSAVAVVFALQLLPLGFLFPATSAARAGHGIGGMWPGTADAFLTTRCLVQVSVYVLTALLVLKLRAQGLPVSDVMKGLVAVLVLQGSYAVVQAVFGFSEIPFYGPRESPDSASGTFVNRNTFAGVMAMGVVLAAALAVHRRERFRWACAAALFAAGLILSRSRGGAVGAAVGLLLLPFLHRGRSSLAGAAAVLALGGAGVMLADPTILLDRFGELAAHEIREDSRWKIWAATAEAAAHQPVLGFGVGTHPHAFHPYQPPVLVGQVHHAHSEYVNAFFEGGVVWAALLVAGFVAWAVRSWQAAQRLAGPDRFLPAAAIAAACAEAVHSLVDFDLRITSAGMLFAALIGLGGPVQAGSRRVWGAACAVAAAAAIALLVVPLDSDARVDEAAKHDTAEAERMCLGALGLSPFNYRAAWVAARGAEERGDEALAERRYGIAADLWPAHPGLQKDVGLRFWAAGGREKAARTLRRLFEQQPSEVEGVMESIWEKERPVAEYEALLPAAPAARAAFAGFVVARGRWKEGLEAFRRGCPEVPENAAAFDAFADRLDAEAQWGMAAAIRARRVQLKSDPAAHGRSARAWARLGALDRALEQAQLARRTDPANPEWAALAGDLHRSRGELEKSLEAYVEAVRAAPKDPAYLVKRAALYAQMKLPASAAEDYRGVLRLRPADREAALGLARSLLAAGDRPGALKAVDDFRSRHPADAEALQLRELLQR